MLIDWFTVGAQALNFAVLVWLMKRFLYQPILQAVNAREQRIAQTVAQADAQKAQAQQERDKLQHERQAFEQQCAALLSQAVEEANAERQRLIEQARQAADALSARRQETLLRDARQFNQTLSQRARQEVFAIAGRALADLADSSLEARICEMFISRLQALDAAAKAALASAFKTGSAPALVRSTIALAPAQRAALQSALNQTFAAEIPLTFETAPALVSGIELSVNGQKLAWSIAAYLTSLEQAVDALLTEEGAAQAAKPSAQPEKSPP
jgi:F-type H+-transporting ATPase subunit b